MNEPNRQTSPSSDCQDKLDVSPTRIPDESLDEVAGGPHVITFDDLYYHSAQPETARTSNQNKR